MSHEIQQLHQIISQLKNARKVSNPEVGSQNKERLNSELENLRGEMRIAQASLQHEAEQNKILTIQLVDMKGSREDSAAAVLRLERELDDSRCIGTQQAEQVASLQNALCQLTNEVSKKDEAALAAAREYEDLQARFSATTETHSRDLEELVFVKSELARLEQDSVRQNDVTPAGDVNTLKEAAMQINKYYLRYMLSCLLLSINMKILNS